ncbi:unnamed protein product, partial [Ceratitis capitata]
MSLKYATFELSNGSSVTAMAILIHKVWVVRLTLICVEKISENGCEMATHGQSVWLSDQLDFTSLILQAFMQNA